MPVRARLPAEPLKRELHRQRRIQRITWEQLAIQLGVSSRTISRLLRARDVAEPVADRMACRLGLHPILLWPRDWNVDARARRTAS